MLLKRQETLSQNHDSATYQVFPFYLRNEMRIDQFWKFPFHAFYSLPEYCINILKRILRNNKLQIRRKLKSAYVVTFPKSFSFSVVNPICPILSCDNGSLSHTSWKRRDKCWRMMWFFLVSWYFFIQVDLPKHKLSISNWYKPIAE